MKKKALVLFSGGLDSRIVSKIIEEQGFGVHLLFVKLPFGGGCGANIEEIKDFSKKQGFELHIVDITNEKLIKNYMELIKNPKFGRGASMNPCKDCKIFIFNEGKKMMEKIGAEILVTGEVLGQRPMSQMKKALIFDDEMAGLPNRILRPLSAKLLPETDYEKSGLIDRKKMFALEGRKRNFQIELAKKYNIEYPMPSGGCLLCDKDYGRRLKVLLEYIENPTYNEILLLKGGRMFKQNGLIIVGRTEQENLLLGDLSEKLGWNLIMDPKIPGPYVIFDKKEDEKLAMDLRNAYESKNSKKREILDKFKI